eukprot:2109247-Pleurochrysis_carterae.AAC.6
MNKVVVYGQVFASTSSTTPNIPLVCPSVFSNASSYGKIVVNAQTMRQPVCQCPEHNSSLSELQPVCAPSLFSSVQRPGGANILKPALSILKSSIIMKLVVTSLNWGKCLCFSNTGDASKARQSGQCRAAFADRRHRTKIPPFSKQKLTPGYIFDETYCNTNERELRYDVRYTSSRSGRSKIRTVLAPGAPEKRPIRTSARLSGARSSVATHSRCGTGFSRDNGQDRKGNWLLFGDVLKAFIQQTARRLLYITRKTNHNGACSRNPIISRANAFKFWTLSAKQTLALSDRWQKNNIEFRPCSSPLCATFPTWATILSWDAFSESEELSRDPCSNAKSYAIIHVSVEVPVKHVVLTAEA